MRSHTLLTALIICLPALAQDTKEHSAAKPFQVEYTIHDANDPTAKNGRHYTLQLDNMNTRANIRTGAKVPYATSTGQNGGAPTQWNYAEIGVNIDCRLYERDGRLMLNSSFEISSLSPNTSGPTPTINQVRTETGTVVTPGTQMALLTIDDPQIPKKLRIVATVTPVP